MEKRGPKPKVTDMGCPNELCTAHLIIGKGNVVGNGSYQLDGKRIRPNGSIAVMNCKVGQRYLIKS